MADSGAAQPAQPATRTSSAAPTEPAAGRNGLGPSVGNYKGVMLCNRPPEAGGTKGGATETAFRTSVVHEVVHPRGQDVELLERRERVPPRRRTKNALDKHVEYLRELTARREALEKERREEQARLEARAARLAERQHQLREQIRNQPLDDGDTASSPARSEEELTPQLQGARGGSSHAAADEKKTDGPERRDAHAPSVAAAARKAGGRGKEKAAGARSRPAWARSAADEDALEDADADELLSFANDLDFGKYVDKLETTAADKLLSTRISDLEELQRAAEEKLRVLQRQAEEAKQWRKRLAAAASGEAGAVRLRRRHRHRHERRRRALLASGMPPSDAKDGAPGAEETSNAATGAARDAGKQSRSHQRRHSNSSSGDGGSSDSSKNNSNSNIDDSDKNCSSDSDSDSARSHASSTLGSLPGPRDLARRRGGDVASIATSILSSASSIRGVHSKRSLAAVIERKARDMKEHIAAGGEGPAEQPQGAERAAAPPPPRIVVIDEAAGALEAKKALISMLPYQHRNPAV